MSFSIDRKGSKIYCSKSYVLVLSSLILLIGFSCGWLGFQLLGDMAGNTQILYVSKQEIMKLEKERVESQKNGEGEMFFGRINEAVGLMHKYAENRKSRNHKVVFVGDSFVNGDNVKSISKQIYKEVIKRMAKIPNE